MNILIVEDDPIMAALLKRIMQKIAIVNIVDSALTFNEAYLRASSDIFDIILMDIYLGRNDPTGLDLCKIIRKKDKEVIIIVITGFHSIEQLERAFEAGATDYIQKPFQRRELEIRVRQWTLMAHKVTYQDQIAYKELSYDINKNDFFLRKKLLLTKKEKCLLSIFLKYPDRLLTNAYLQEKFWGDYDLIKKRNIRSNIQGLRNALSPFCHKWLKTVRGEGYIFARS